MMFAATSTTSGADDQADVEPLGRGRRWPRSRPPPRHPRTAPTSSHGAVPVVRGRDAADLRPVHRVRARHPPRAPPQSVVAAGHGARSPPRADCTCSRRRHDGGLCYFDVRRAAAGRRRRRRRRLGRCRSLDGDRRLRASRPYEPRRAGVVRGDRPRRRRPPPRRPTSSALRCPSSSIEVRDATSAPVGTLRGVTGDVASSTRPAAAVVADRRATARRRSTRAGSTTVEPRCRARTADARPPCPRRRRCWSATPRLDWTGDTSRLVGSTARGSLRLRPLAALARHAPARRRARRRAWSASAFWQLRRLDERRARNDLSSRRRWRCRPRPSASSSTRRRRGPSTTSASGP